jgi:hypothetical protein
VGGAILKGSTGVLIGGMPAARQGDMVTCSGPPDSVAAGCPTVLIGEAGAGGGGNAGGAACMTAVRAALMSAVIAGPGPESRQKGDEHILDVAFVDRAGKPLAGISYAIRDPRGGMSRGALDGRILHHGVCQGDHQITLRAITGVRWNTLRARTSDPVTLTIETAGLDDGERITISTYACSSADGERLLSTVEGAVSDNRLEVEYTFEPEDIVPPAGLCRHPDERARALVRVSAGELNERSGLLTIRPE